MTATRIRGGQRGFSLLEVLVAFAILAMSMGVLMQIFSGGLRNVELSDQHSRATALARSLLARVGTEVPLIAGEKSGDFDDGLTWRLIMQPIEDIPPPANQTVVPIPFGLMAVVIIVEWQDGRAGKRDLTLHSARIYNKPQ